MLNPEQIEQLRMMTSTSGWGILKQVIAERAHGAIKDLARLPAERSERYKTLDDSLASFHIRGRLEESEWVLTAVENEIKVHDMNRRMEELQREQNGPAPAENPPLG